jgi:hypothetical protein
MEMLSPAAPARRPPFRRAPEPPAFRVTDDDVAIVRQLARHRFLRSTHIAALVVNGFQDPRKAGVMGLLAAPVAMLA